MHTIEIQRPSGEPIRIHHNSDWSGDVLIVRGEESASIPGSLARALLDLDEWDSLNLIPPPPDPWAGVALVTVTYPGPLTREMVERIKAHLEPRLCQHTKAPILIFEGGGTLALHGEDPGHPVGVLQVPPEAVGLADDTEQRWEKLYERAQEIDPGVSSATSSLLGFPVREVEFPTLAQPVVFGSLDEKDHAGKRASTGSVSDIGAIAEQGEVPTRREPGEISELLPYLCRDCIFWKEDRGIWTVTGWTGDGSRGTCHVEPTTVARHADALFCRHGVRKVSR